MSNVAVRDLAHASIPVPRGMVHLGVARVDVFLRQSSAGHYRWFYSSGSPTVVEADSVPEAVRVAQLVWSDVQLLQQTTPHA